MTEVVRVQRLARPVEDRKGEQDLPLLSVSATKGVVQRSTLTSDEPRAEDLTNYRLCRAGDLVINRMSAYQGALGQARQDGVVSPDYLVLRPNSRFNVAFGEYLMKIPWFVSQMASRVRGIGSAELGTVRTPRINWADLGQIEVALPDAAQQRRIAEFLDRETAQIDELIAKQQQLISTLAERERETLRHAMLMASAEAPTVSLSMLARVGNGSTPSRERLDYWADGSIPWLNSSVANADFVREPSELISETALRECHLPMVAPGSTLVGLTGQGRTRGMATRLGITATISQHLAYVTPGRRLNADFLYWALANEYEQFRETSDGNGGTKGGLTCEAIRRTKIPVPDLERQADISFGLQSAAETATKVGHRVASAIDLLRERRQALISAAVTGQIEVGSRTI